MLETLRKILCAFSVKIDENVALRVQRISKRFGTPQSGSILWHLKRFAYTPRKSVVFLLAYNLAYLLC